jgi:hypothetical protein
MRHAGSLPQFRAPPAALALCLSLPAFEACSGQAEGSRAPEAGPADSAPEVRFVDGTEAAGITFRHDKGKSEDRFYVEQICAGAIFFDAEGDGDPDLYLLDGTRVLGPPAGPPPVNTLYLNDGAGRFTDGTAVSGLGDPRYAEGVCGADVDNDGDQDLFVTNFDGPNALYVNDGAGRFADLASAAGVEGGPCLDSSAAFADVDNDGWLDLYVGYYLDHSRENNRVCRAPNRQGVVKRRYCSVEAYEPLPDIFYRNKGDGSFEDASERFGIAGHLGRTLGVAFADYDDDGDADLFVACDRNANLYYQNVGGRFEEQALDAGVAVSAAGRNQAGMGVVSGDFDGDQRIDVVVTYFEGEWNGFYRNCGKNRFEDVAARNGTAAASTLLLGWGVEFFDADLDGDLDVLVANGHVVDDIREFRKETAGYEQPNLFYRNDGRGSFISLGPAAGPGLELVKVSRGLAVADVDGDGDLDALVANLDDRPDLLRNDSPHAGRHWLLLRTLGTKSNRDGIGARVIAHLPDRVLMREVRTGQSYLSQSDLRVHLGLGSTSVVPLLEVRWPSGRTSRLENVPADQVLQVVEPEG